MAFVLTLTPTFEVDVKVSFPIDGGKMHEASFQARFKRPTQTQIDALIEQVNLRSISDADVLDAYLVDWSGVTDEDGNAIACADAARERVLDVYPVRPRLVRAFLGALHEAREKNS